MELNDQKLQTSTKYDCSKQVAWTDTFCFSTLDDSTLERGDILKLHLKHREENQFKKLSTTVASLSLDLPQMMVEKEDHSLLEGWFDLEPEEKNFQSGAKELVGSALLVVSSLRRSLFLCSYPLSLITLPPVPFQTASFDLLAHRGTNIWS